MKIMKVKKFLRVLLYLLPVVFFIVCYFLIITSGEDIFQGANTAPNVIGDSIDAFHHSSRLADMYTWSVINFFDYSFSFGPDTIFRLIDVFAAVGVLYMITYIALKRRPKLCLKDASIFNLSFLFIFLTWHGYTLYSGFSAIHNYLFISFFTLQFLLFYIRDLWGRPACPLKNKKIFTILMFILGFIFGFASNVTSIVFLLTLAVYAVYLKIKKQKLHLKEFFLSWHGASILGILIAIALIYIVGNGLTDYESTSDYIVTYDYLPFSEIFTNIPDAIRRIFLHNVKNFGRFIVPFIIATVPLLTAIFISAKQKLIKLTKFTANEKNFLFAAISFIILHILIFSQLEYPTRLVLPAYLLAIAVFLFIAKHYLDNLKTRVIPFVLASTIIILSTGLVIARAYFAIDYRGKVLPTLEMIKNSENFSLCLDKETITSKSIPLIHLGQDSLLADWALPETIYNKSVTICDQTK